ncbi:MAG: phosphoserine transaminase [Actinomycetaceae bacterium]|nr:phosphoserine transaminase [Actinomycetaceae bacterium]
MDYPKLPASILPTDGRFGCGPTRIPPTHIKALFDVPLGTSHRQPPVRHLVSSVRAQLTALYGAQTHEVVLGNGGSTAFWAVALASLVRRRSAHAVSGEFGGKFAAEAAKCPYLEEPQIFRADPGRLATVEPVAEADVYAWAHNETSTGVVAPVKRPGGGDTALTVVDGTSIAGATPADLDEVDVYYFAPQKALAAEGGLWLALCHESALERAAQLCVDARRWVPDILNLHLAAANSRKNQTVNTPALVTLALLDMQLRQIIGMGGLEGAHAHCQASSKMLYDWADGRVASPFVAVESWRSPVVVTLDFHEVDATWIASAARANGIVDIEPYRKLGRNQLRIGTYPAVPHADVEALRECLNYLVERAPRRTEG